MNMVDNPLVLLALVVGIFILAALAWFLSSKRRKNKEVQDLEEAAQQKVQMAESDLNRATTILDLPDDGREEVSIEKVDLLTEYEIYVQFGYIERAAKTLEAYLSSLPQPPLDLSKKLLGHFLDCDLIDDYAATLDNLIDEEALTKEEVAFALVEGLKKDRNNLNLRLTAETQLGWGPEEVLANLGESLKDILAKQKPVPVIEKEDAEPYQTNYSDSLDVLDYKILPTSTEEKSHFALIAGHARFKGLTNNEKQTIIGFMAPRRRARLLMNAGDYDNAMRSLEAAIKDAARPLTLLIDLLHLDYVNKNIDAYAQHLWEFYFALGDYGQAVKEKLLGIGYALGYHQAFYMLERAISRQMLEAIGVECGYMGQSAGSRKFHHLPLVIEADKASGSIGQASSGEMAVMEEAESQLNYGQVAQAIGTLEEGIYANPEAVQLYPMLLDLYERLDDKERFEQFSQKVREVCIHLPVEATLSISHLSSRFQKSALRQ